MPIFSKCDNVYGIKILDVPRKVIMNLYDEQMGQGCRVKVFLAWSSIAQSVCQQAFSLLKIGFQRPSGFESRIQQRKTTCLLSIRKSLACARASKWTTTNMYIARARCECQMAVGSGGLNACWSYGRAVELKFFSMILDNSVGLSAGIQSAEDWVSETLWVRIPHSAEEDNLSPFDSKIACLCQSIEINNNKSDNEPAWWTNVILALLLHIYWSHPWYIQHDMYISTWDWFPQSV